MNVCGPAWRFDHADRSLSQHQRATIIVTERGASWIARIGRLDDHS
jgi:hypothetical protein